MVLNAHILQPRAIFLYAFVLTGVLAYVTSTQAQAQVLPKVAAPKATAPASSPDPLKRENPRNAIYAYLQACHEGKLDLAAEYLDLSRLRNDQQTQQGPELANQLCELLDRNTQFEVGRLSREETGNFGDGLPTDIDHLASFDLNNRTIWLSLHRTIVEGRQVWLVSPDSVLEIPRLVSLTGESKIEKRLPAALVETRFVGTPLYIWFALIIAALLLGAVSRFLARVAIALLRPVARRTGQTLQEHRLESFVEPLRVMLTVFAFSGIVEAIGPSAILRDYIYKLMALLFFVGVALLLMRVVDVLSDTVITRAIHGSHGVRSAVVPLIVRSVKILIGSVAALSVLSAWGYNTNTILAGLGVGGLAVALAAQKTIENLFGGVSIIWDRPVVVGDFCKFGDQVGTIEEIGLRSTRIRTLDRTVVTIPNSVFSTMTLENFAKRDRMWFHPTISLHRETPATKITAMMDAITDVLKQNSMVDPTSVPLRFTKIGKDSFDLEVFAYVLTPDFDEFLRVQSQLILGIVEAAAKLDVLFAYSMQETLLPEHLRIPVSGQTVSAGQEMLA